MSDQNSSSDLARPRVVTIAYWLWLVSAVLSIVFALLIFTVPADSLRDTLTEQGSSDAAIDSFLTLLRGVAVISAVVGLVLGALSGPVKRGDARFRRALVALSAVFALIVLVSSTFLPPEVVVVTVLLAVASVLVYRPSAKAWFAR